MSTAKRTDAIGDFVRALAHFCTESLLRFVPGNTPQMLSIISSDGTPMSKIQMASPMSRALRCTSGCDTSASAGTQSTELMRLKNHKADDKGTSHPKKCEYGLFQKRVSGLTPVRRAAPGL